jgi:light-regulated signal transduction histidine kinase (bacteriophytochrome)
LSARPRLPAAEARVTALHAALPKAPRVRPRPRPAKVDGADYRAKYIELSQDLDELLFSIAHDLRAPLRALDGFSEALVEEYGEVLAQPGGEYVAEIQSASRHMRALLEGVLLLSRLGRQAIELEDIDLSAIAQSVATDAARADSSRRVEFSIAAGARGKGDRGLVREVLKILFDNAWKFTRTRGAARIEFGVVGGRKPCFFVHDNGIGFDATRPDNGGLLLAPFQVLHPAEDGSGIGVGLAAAQRIVRRHGGRIWAEAEIDRGATFFFTLAGEGRR